MILTADLSTLAPGETRRRATLHVEAPSVRVPDRDELHPGGHRTIPFDKDGRLSVELLDTDTPNTDPESWQYRLQVRWLGGSLPAFPAELTGDVDLADIQPMDPVDPVYLPPTISQERVVGLGAALGAKASQDELDALSDTVAAKADAAATTSALATKIASPASPAEGQLLKWDATLGQWVVTNPVGASLNASAINTTAVATSASSSSGVGTVVSVPGTAISVTNSGGRMVDLEFEASFVQSVVGTGSGWLALFETTSTPVARKYNIKNLPNSTAAGLSTISLGLTKYPLGVVTTTRTFELRWVIYQASGSPAANLVNGLTHPTLLRAINL